MVLQADAKSPSASWRLSSCLYPKQNSIGWSQRSIWRRKNARIRSPSSTPLNRFYPPRRRLPRCDVVTAIPQTGQGQRAQPTMKRVTKWAQLACHASHILTKLACHASHILTRRLVSSMSSRRSACRPGPRLLALPTIAASSPGWAKSPPRRPKCLS
jgi:hypothetical protein